MNEAIDEAKELLEAGDWRDAEGDHASTQWVHATVRADDDEGEVAHVRVTIEPVEPTCTSVSGHDWADGDPWGHGGGVVYTDVCRNCQLRRTRDTWAQDPSNGEQGLESTSYSNYDDR